MWTCPNCSNQSEVPAEVCPSCGAVDVEVVAADRTATASTFSPFVSDAEEPTEHEVQSFPDTGPAVVECYIGVTEPEASAVAARLRDLGISVYVSRDDSGTGPVHRVQVPLVDLGRALAVIDLLHKRRSSRS